MLRRPAQTICSQSPKLFTNDELTGDNDPVDEKNDVPKIIVLHTAAAIFEFELGQLTGVQTHLCKVIVIRDPLRGREKKQ